MFLDKESLDKEFDPRSAGAARTVAEFVYALDPRARGAGGIG